MSERRDRILKANIEKIEFCHARATEDGVISPVILVLDLSDQLGRNMAIQLAGQSRVADVMKAAEQQHGDSILTTDMPCEGALATVANLSKTGADELSELVSIGRIPVIVISDGGVTWSGLEQPL